MAVQGLDERKRFVIVIALTADSGDSALFAQQDEEGRKLGLTRAEIAAARRGFSFDFSTSKAIALALAREEGVLNDSRSQAMRAGIDTMTCAEIERMAAELAVIHSAKVCQNER
ncbi:hypothetical protein ACVWV0_004351 [Ewingella americana]